MKKNKFNWQTLVILVLLVCLASASIFIVNKEKEKISNIEPEKVYVDSKSEKVLDNFNRESAVKSLQEIFVEIGKDVEGKDRTPQERLAELDKEKTTLEDIISKETLDKLYLSEEFNDDEFNQRFLASSLLTYYQVISEITGNKEFKPVLNSEVFNDMIYFDSKLMVSQIPFDVFAGDNRGIAFEMQYLDGEWKFNPYSSMMALVMIVNYEKQMILMEEKSKEKPESK